MAKFHSKQNPNSYASSRMSRPKSANATTAKHRKTLTATSNGAVLKRLKNPNGQELEQAGGQLCMATQACPAPSWPCPRTPRPASRCIPPCPMARSCAGVGWAGATPAPAAQPAAANLVALPPCLLLSRDLFIWLMNFVKTVKKKEKKLLWSSAALSTWSEMSLQPQAQQGMGGTSA